MTDRQKLFLMVLSTGLAILLASGIRRLDPSLADHASFGPALTLPLWKSQS